MQEILIISIGLVLVIEGLIYFMLASKLHMITELIKNIDPQTIKIFSLVIALVGICLIYFTFRFYGEIK
tara:strand:- start:91 stop:297 length:207 start_codon:yes stop_codon:yes gene_type:complete